MLIALNDLNMENGISPWKNGISLEKGKWIDFSGDLPLNYGKAGGGVAIILEFEKL